MPSRRPAGTSPLRAGTWSSVSSLFSPSMGIRRSHDLATARRTLGHRHDTDPDGPFARPDPRIAERPVRSHSLSSRGNDPDATVASSGDRTPPGDPPAMGRNEARTGRPLHPNTQNAVIEPPSIHVAYHNTDSAASRTSAHHAETGSSGRKLAIASRSGIRCGCLYCSTVPPLRARRRFWNSAQDRRAGGCVRTGPSLRVSRLLSYSTLQAPEVLLDRAGQAVRRVGSGRSVSSTRSV